MGVLRSGGLALVVVLGGAGVLVGQEGDTEVRGRVLAAGTGEVVAGAWIALEGRDWGTYSRSDGTFALPQVPDGPRRYEVEALGYETALLTLDPADEIQIVELAPDPVQLEGVEVVTDRFRARRNAVATSVRVFDKQRLAFEGGSSRSMADFLRLRTPVSARRLSDCFRYGGSSAFQSYRRVGWASLAGVGGGCDGFGPRSATRVCLDEMPLPGGMETLEMYQAHDFYMVEVYGRGAQVRLYTEDFIERAAGQRLRPAPLATSFC